MNVTELVADPYKTLKKIPDTHRIFSVIEKPLALPLGCATGCGCSRAGISRSPHQMVNRIFLECVGGQTLVPWASDIALCACVTQVVSTEISCEMRILSAIIE